MKIRSWLYRGLALGAIVAAVGYLRRRRRSDADAETEPSTAVTEREATAALVRRRVDPDRLESVREHALETLADDPVRLLGLEEVTTASLFLTTDRGEPELVWYVEAPRSAADWDGGSRRLESAFPLENEGISEGEWIDRELLVHAVLPERPRTATGDGRAVVPGEEIDRDVALVRLPLESGLPERVADLFAGMSRRVIDGELDLGPLERWSAEMLEAESMFTETIFLERTPDGYALVQYMETEEMEGVYDAYYDTWNPVARLSELVVGRALEEPDRILTLPLGTDAELLVHAVDPDRPRRLEEWE